VTVGLRVTSVALGRMQAMRTINNKVHYEIAELIPVPPGDEVDVD